MNPVEQKERATAVHALEKRLNEQFEAVITKFDEELESIYRKRTADGMTASAQASQIEQWMGETQGLLNGLRKANLDAYNVAIENTDREFKQVYSWLNDEHAALHDHLNLTFWGRLKWLFRGITDDRVHTKNS